MNNADLITKNHCLKKARLMSFAALACLFLNFYLVQILSRYSPNGASSFFTQISSFNALGVLIGVILCPVFLPLLLKPANKGIVFIVLVTLPNIILRALGVDLWISSPVINGIIHTLSSILIPLCYGQFFRTHLYTPNNENRTGKYCVFLFAVLIALGHFARDILQLLLNVTGISQDPVKAMSLIYNVLLFCIAGASAFTIASVLYLSKIKDMSAMQALLLDNNKPADWQFIFRLIGIAAVSSILNGLMNGRYLPLLEMRNRLNFAFIPVIMIPVIGFFAGKSIKKFLRRFLMPAVIFFIMLPVFIVLESNPFLLYWIDNLVTLFYNLLWVVLTAAAVEAYYPSDNSKYQGFLFYFVSAAAHFFLNHLTFIIIPLNRYIPAGIESSIVIICVSAILFILLSFRIFVPKFDLINKKISSASGTAYEDIYRKYRLTKHEIIVADMIVKDGSTNDQISKKVFRSVDTIKKHVSNIFAKFGVHNRAELMSKIMREASGS